MRIQRPSICEACGAARHRGRAYGSSRGSWDIISRKVKTDQGEGTTDSQVTSYSY